MTDLNTHLSEQRVSPVTSRDLIQVLIQQPSIPPNTILPALKRIYLNKLYLFHSLKIFKWLSLPSVTSYVYLCLQGKNSSYDIHIDFLAYGQHFGWKLKFVILGSDFIDLLVQVEFLTCFKIHLSLVLKNFSHTVQSLFLVVNGTPCLSRFFFKF